MKFLHIFFLFSFILISCNPLRLDGENGRERKRDSARGEDRFQPPDIKDINLSEIRNKSFSGHCAEYKNIGSFSILGNVFPGKQLQNCLAQAVDESLKPLCDHEKNLQEALKYYKRKGDEDKIEEIELLLEEVEETKYDTADELYSIADEFDEIQEGLLDNIDDHYNQKDDLNIAQTIGRGLGRIVVKSEVGGFTRVLDSRARRACRGQIDFSKISRRK